MLLLTETSRASDEKLEGVRWKLTQLGRTKFKDSAAFIHINGIGTQFTGHTGCNRMFGGVRVRGSRISFSRVGTTRMMCELVEGEVHEVDLLRALRQSYRYQIRSNELRLLDRRGRTNLRFERVLTRPLPNIDPGRGDGFGSGNWNLESIGADDQARAYPGVFIKLDDAGGKVSGNSGCNMFGGEFSSSAGSIRFRKIFGTMRACAESGKMEVERNLHRGLNEATRFEINGDELRLFNGDKQLLRFRRDR